MCISPSICSSFSEHCPHHPDISTHVRMALLYGKCVYLPGRPGWESVNTVSTNVYRVQCSGHGGWTQNESDLLLGGSRSKKHFRCNFQLRYVLWPPASSKPVPSQFNSIISRTLISFTFRVLLHEPDFFPACRKLENHPDGQFITFHFHFNFSTIRFNRIQQNWTRCVRYGDNSRSIFIIIMSWCRTPCMHMHNYCTTIEVNWINGMTRNKYSSMGPALSVDATVQAPTEHLRRSVYAKIYSFNATVRHFS